ncbi:MAG: cysteine desulfurase NifS [Oscillospiraceae bacterium]|nr:cysteine desulfurase NifS [Oscillospiraceae bacterium]
MSKIIYADNAATTPVSPQVLQEMLPYFTENYGNASTVYSVGRGNRSAIAKARKQVADAIGAVDSEIYFTAGGSESDNWAVKGVAKKQAEKGKKHLITTKIEHHAILHTMEALEKEGFEVTYLPVDSCGLVTPQQVEAAIRPDTALVSVMYANNEIGTIEPIGEIGEVCRRHGVIFHTDAVQAVGSVEINVKEQNIDLLSMSGHKFNAPKGIGALYIRKGIQLINLIDGGSQEKGKRAGTENVPGIVGLGKAIELATSDIPAKAEKLKEMRDIVIRKALSLPKSRLNGHPENRLPGNANFCFEGIEGEGMLLKLDGLGICAASGSACTSASLDPSHVLLAIGLPHEIAHGSLRITFSDANTTEEAEFIGDRIIQVVTELRKMSPVWED